MTSYETIEKSGSFKTFMDAGMLNTIINMDLNSPIMFRIINQRYGPWFS